MYGWRCLPSASPEFPGPLGRHSGGVGGAQVVRASGALPNQHVRLCGARARDTRARTFETWEIQQNRELDLMKQLYTLQY